VVAEADQKLLQARDQFLAALAELDTSRCTFEHTTLEEVKVMDLPLLMGEYKQLVALMRRVRVAAEPLRACAATQEADHVSPSGDGASGASTAMAKTAKLFSLFRFPSVGGK
jgi:hypothetical protein